ncbi:MAG: hypothetical protein ACRECA_13655 [Pseudolabrys sp.]
MSLRRALFIAACLLPCAAATAVAQFQPAPAAPPQGEPPPCVKEFLTLRDIAGKKASAIKTASARHAPAKEACSLFNAFSAAEAKMMKYAEDNSVWCGIPPQVIQDIKKSHTKTDEIRTRVCQAAAMPARPKGPSLSDALSAPVTAPNNIKTGRGTFDTLTGTPLGK